MANFGDTCDHHKLGSFYDPLKFFKKGSPRPTLGRAHVWSACAKAARKTLVKLTPDMEMPLKNLHSINQFVSC